MEVIIDKFRMDGNSKCSKCKNDDKYIIFVTEKYFRGENGKVFSNIYGSYCDEHLKQGIDDAIIYRNVQQKLKENEDNKKKLEKAIKLVSDNDIDVMKLIREKKIERINRK